MHAWVCGNTAKHGATSDHPNATNTFGDRLHRKVEARAPLLSAQLSEARTALLSVGGGGDWRPSSTSAAGAAAFQLLSTERAAHLGSLPLDQLSLADTARLVVHSAVKVCAEVFGWMANSI